MSIFVNPNRNQIVSYIHYVVRRNNTNRGNSNDRKNNWGVKKPNKRNHEDKRYKNAKAKVDFWNRDFEKRSSKVVNRDEFMNRRRDLYSDTNEDSGITDRIESEERIDETKMEIGDLETMDAVDNDEVDNNDTFNELEDHIHKLSDIVQDDEESSYPSIESEERIDEPKDDIDTEDVEILVEKSSEIPLTSDFKKEDLFNSILEKREDMKRDQIRRAEELRNKQLQLERENREKEIKREVENKSSKDGLTLLNRDVSDNILYEEWAVTEDIPKISEFLNPGNEGQNTLQDDEDLLISDGSKIGNTDEELRSDEDQETFPNKDDRTMESGLELGEESTGNDSMEFDPNNAVEGDGDDNDEDENDDESNNSSFRLNLLMVGIILFVLFVLFFLYSIIPIISYFWKA